MAGDLTYFWIPSPDPERGRAFYGGLFDTWRLQPRDQDDGYHVEGLTVPGAVVGGREGDRPHLYFGVDDLADAVAELGELGGQAEEIVEFLEGASAECTYDGVQFGLFRPAEGLDTPAPCDKPGDLAYFVVPIGLPDDARAFYASVLGWDYEHDDIEAAYHHITNCTPPGGLFTEVDASRPISYFRVPYLDMAMRRVRELGGEVGAPTDSTTGSSVDCTDDQGVHFSLWQPAPGY